MVLVTQLKVLRLFTGLGIYQLAQEIGIARSTLGLIEVGYQRCPAKWKEPIAAALHVSPDILFDERGMARLLSRECVTI